MNEGTLHNGSGDARVDGRADSHTEAQTAECIAALEASRRVARERSRAAAEAEAEMANADSPTELSARFARLQHFALQPASGGGPELKLYDAMTSPDRQLLKLGFFVAEGSLVVQQLLTLSSTYRLSSILATEAQLGKLVDDISAADAAYTRLGESASVDDAAASDGADSATGSGAGACVVYYGSRGDLSRATGFRHSALSILAVVRRPQSVHLPLERWLPSLRAAPGTMAPTLLVLDSVIKPDNVGALMRTALAFGVCGVRGRGSNLWCLATALSASAPPPTGPRQKL